MEVLLAKLNKLNKVARLRVDPDNKVSHDWKGTYHLNVVS